MFNKLKWVVKPYDVNEDRTLYTLKKNSDYGFRFSIEGVTFLKTNKLINSKHPLWYSYEPTIISSVLIKYVDKDEINLKPYKLISGEKDELIVVDTTSFIENSTKYIHNGVFYIYDVNGEIQYLTEEELLFKESNYHLYVLYEAKKALNIVLNDENDNLITTITTTVDNGYFDDEIVNLLDHITLTNGYYVHNSRFYKLEDGQDTEVTFDIDNNTYILKFIKEQKTITINYNDEDNVTFHTIVMTYDVGETYSISVPSTYNKNSKDYVINGTYYITGIMDFNNKVENISYNTIYVNTIELRYNSTLIDSKTISGIKNESINALTTFGLASSTSPLIKGTAYYTLNSNASYPSYIVPISKTTLTHTFNLTKLTSTVNITYKDSNNVTIKTDTLTGFVGDSYTVPTTNQTISGKTYNYQNAVGNLTGSYTYNTPHSVTLNYHQLITYNVVFIDLDNSNNVVQTISKSTLVNQTFNLLTELGISNVTNDFQLDNKYYKLDTGVSGSYTITDATTTININMKRVTSTVNITYKDSNNVTIKTDTLTGFVGASYSVSTTSQTISGKTYNYQSVVGNLTGTYTYNTPINVTLNYKQLITYNVVLVDLDDSNSVVDTTSVSTLVGENLNILTHLSIASLTTDFVKNSKYYKLDSSVTQTYLISESTTQITINLKRVTSTVTVTHRDSFGALIKTDTLTGFVGNSYTVVTSTLNYNGKTYTYQNASGSLSGTYTYNSPITVTLNYRELVMFTVNVIDLDDSNNVIKTTSQSALVNTTFNTFNYLGITVPTQTFTINDFVYVVDGSVTQTVTINSYTTVVNINVKREVKNLEVIGYDTSGTNVILSETYPYKIGESYSYTIKENIFDTNSISHKFSSIMSGSTSGVMTASGATLELNYVKSGILQFRIQNFDTQTDVSADTFFDNDSYVLKEYDLSSIENYITFDDISTAMYTQYQYQHTKVIGGVIYYYQFKDFNDNNNWSHIVTENDIDMSEIIVNVLPKPIQVTINKNIYDDSNKTNLIDTNVDVIEINSSLISDTAYRYIDSMTNNYIMDSYLIQDNYGSPIIGLELNVISEIIYFNQINYEDVYNITIDYIPE